MSGENYISENGDNYAYEKIEVSELSDVDDDGLFNDISDIEVDTDVGDLENFDKLQLTVAEGKMKESIQVSKSQEANFLQKKSQQNLEVIDDFIRNYLIKHKMTQTLQIFQQDWFELSQKGQIDYQKIGPVPQIYLESEKLEEEIDILQNDLEKAQIQAEKHKATFERLKKERDQHKIHHNRVQQEKVKLNKNLENLKKVHEKYEFTYEKLSKKYERAMKEKMLLKLEKERLVIRNVDLQKSKKELEEKISKEFGDPDEEAKRQKKEALAKKRAEKAKKVIFTPYPPDDRENPYANRPYEPYNSKNLVQAKSFQGHMNAITQIAMHPKKSIVATASDDLTWKIWTLPHGELIMSGEGHKDWVSGIDFHPKGSHLATCSGDSTVKIWDFLKAQCVATFTDHIHPVWSVGFNDTGDFLVSGSIDHTAKIFDVPAGKARGTFRGHVDSINHVKFQPFSNIFATASADKTVSLWDIRTNLLIQTFYGHLNAVNHVDFNLKGDSLCSCDSDGIVKIWDIRMVEERNQFDCNMNHDNQTFSANSCHFDQSGTIVAVACEDCAIRIFSDGTTMPTEFENELQEHKDAVHDVKFDYNSKMLISCSSDCTFRIYQ